MEKKLLLGIIFLFFNQFVFKQITLGQTPVLKAVTATVTTYPGPEGIKASDKYSVEINGKSSFVYKTVDQTNKNIRSASFTDFAFSGGSATIKVVSQLGTIGSVIVRPLSLGIKPIINGNVMTFNIDKPCKLSVEIAGVYTKDLLFIFADAPEVNVPSPTDPNVIYFGPGVHDIGSNYTIPGGKTLYIAGGAYVTGAIKNRDQSNIKILGRGVISGRTVPHVDWHPGDVWGDWFYYTVLGSSSTIDGVTIIDSPQFVIKCTGNNNIVNNVKMIAWHINTDGIHPGTQDGIFNDLFLYVHDDALCVGEGTGGHIFTNCVIFQEKAKVIAFTYGNNPKCSNVLVKNISVIHYDINTNMPQWNYGSVFHFAGGAKADFSNFTIENVTIETLNGINKRFITLEPFKSPGAQKKSGYGVMHNFLFKNITVLSPTEANFIYGKNDNGMQYALYDIIFDNLVVNGKQVTKFSDANIDSNQYVYNIKFTSSHMDQLKNE